MHLMVACDFSACAVLNTPEARSVFIQNDWFETDLSAWQYTLNCLAKADNNTDFYIRADGRCGASCKHAHAPLFLTYEFYQVDQEDFFLYLVRHPILNPPLPVPWLSSDVPPKGPDDET